MGPLLNIQGLTVAYDSRTGPITAVDHVNLQLQQDEFLAIVGESGCGKSTLGLSIIGLLPKPPAKSLKDQFSTRVRTLYTCPGTKSENIAAQKSP